MARPVRIEYAGAVYHVMARGNHGRPIFADDLDRKAWLNTLGQACEKTGWRIHAWVLMRNHYHLLVETPEANWVAGMKWLQGTYTQRYSSRDSVFGHSFQGRYQALVVEAAAGGLSRCGQHVLAAGGLPERPKGLAEKQVLAWWLRGRTTMGRRWISERLGMGEESGVSRAVRKVKVGRAGKPRTLNRRLQADGGNQSKNATVP